MKRKRVKETNLFFFRRRNISIEKAIVQMYLAGVSVRRVEDNKTEKWCRWPESKLQCNLLFLFKYNVKHVVFYNIFTNIILGLYSRILYVFPVLTS